MASLKTSRRIHTLQIFLTLAESKARGTGKYTRVCVTLLLALFWLSRGLQPARAVTYYVPEPEHWSDNRQFVLRVDNKQHRLTLQQKKTPPFRTLWSISYPQRWWRC